MRPTFRSLIALAFSCCLWLPASQPSAAPAAETVRLVGGGASFPAPLYQRWFRDYYLAHPGVQVDYQALGSGAGVTNLLAGRFDFAGSDVRLDADALGEVEGSLIQIPMTAGAVVLAYHVPGVEDLRLSRDALAGIFLGTVSRWNDPSIAATNDGADLPDLAITVVARAETSGTSHAFTRHLSAVSPDFAERVGVTADPAWPQALTERGALVRAQGSGGAAAFVKSIPGAIGYLPYAYAHFSDLPIAALQNREGKLVAADAKSFAAAVAALKAEMDPAQVADPGGEESYPILAVSWLLIPRALQDPAKGQALGDLVRYCLTEGQKLSGTLGYIPFSEATVARLLERLESGETR